MSISWEGEEAGGAGGGRFEASNKTIVNTDDPTSASSNSREMAGRLSRSKTKAQEREKERHRGRGRERERGHGREREREEGPFSRRWQKKIELEKLGREITKLLKEYNICYGSLKSNK